MTMATVQAFNNLSISGMKIPFSNCGKTIPQQSIWALIESSGINYHGQSRDSTLLPRSCQQIPKYHLIFHMLLPTCRCCCWCCWCWVKNKKTIKRIAMAERKANDIPWLHKSSILHPKWACQRCSKDLNAPQGERKIWSHCWCRISI